MALTRGCVTEHPLDYTEGHYTEGIWQLRMRNDDLQEFYQLTCLTDG